MAQRATAVQPSQSTQGPQGGSEVRTPSNRAEFEALALLRSELRSQISTTTQLRQELTNQLAQAAAVNDNASIAKLQARIRSMEARSANLEQRLLQVDDAVSGAIARGIVTERSEAVPAAEAVPAIAPVAAFPPVFENPNAKFTEEVLASVVLGMTLLFTFVGMLIHRRAWRRAEKKFATVGPGGRAELQQLQQAVDVIAVEVERIAEGQRYVSKLLNERFESPSLPDGRERVPVVLKDADAPAGGR
jgi:hypothetical protein